MTPEKISFAVQLNDECPIFHLRTISVNEESEMLGRLVEIEDGDPEKDQKLYDFCVDVLKSFSVEAPEQFIDVKGKEERKSLVKSPVSIESDIDFYFAEKTHTKERIADMAVAEFKRRMRPRVRSL